jgi:hypothetical protein
MSISPTNGVSVSGGVSSSGISSGGVSLGAEGRFFLDFDSTAGQFLTFDAPIALVGNFSGSIDVFLSSSVSGNDTVFCGADGNEDSVIMDVSSSDVRLFAFVGTSLQSVISVTNPADNKLYTIYFSYSGSTASLQVKGGSASTATWSLNGSQNIGDVGRREGTSNGFNEYIANMELTVGPSLLANVKIDQDFSKTSQSFNSANSSNNLTTTNITSSEFFTLSADKTQWNGAGGSTIVIAS